ncbi:SHOCT domain-containing protein [Arthrobacter woluwensis]|uniref:Short C-terminal domain-containing protein n=1 Tax=Arthrobacter woluwensis TaxID=156980 RepID=A0A1H4JGW8_9MICC|nr:SHOCT domain-containing protein [Arthrobacter woluwensis]SEB45523.1 Short C-terminal domain-containing protein [Arthrobacter woluwensis]
MAAPQSLFPGPVDRRAVLRIAATAHDAAVLPEGPERIVPPMMSVWRRLLLGVVLLAGSVLAVWVITVGAWDDEGFFPWYWNVLWLFFPWIFLVQAWLPYLAGWKRYAESRRFIDHYAAFRQESVRVPGTVTGTLVRTAESNDAVSALVVKVHYEWPPGKPSDVVVASRAPGIRRSEAPENGDPAFIWIERDAGRASSGASASSAKARMLVQLSRAARTERRPASTTVGLAEELEALAVLHRNGELSSEEFTAAKARLLG